jgi:hypothetical protein
MERKLPRQAIMAYRRYKTLPKNKESERRCIDKGFADVLLWSLRHGCGRNTRKKRGDARCCAV